MTGRHSHWKVVGDMPPSRPLYHFNHSSWSETHNFKLFSSSRGPILSFNGKMNFQAQFWLNFSSWDTNFTKILFLRPQCSTPPKKQLRRPLLKTWGAQTYHPFFFSLVGPTPPRDCVTLCKHSSNRFLITERTSRDFNENQPKEGRKIFYFFNFVRWYLNH